MTTKEIFENESIPKMVEMLTERNAELPLWSDLVKEYDAKQHKIITDNVTRQVKVRKGGVEEPARITYAMQKLATKRMTQMTFTIPVERVYKVGNDLQQAQADAIEAVYKKARIDAINKKRFNAYFASCEMAVIWYAHERKNEDYGFKSDYKLRCVCYSPMETKYSNIEQADIYPLFDEYGDLIALSIGIERIEGKRAVRYLTTYTDNRVVTFKKEKEWEVYDDVENTIGKIQGVYISRPEPIWENATNNTQEIEYTLSRHSDIIRRNSAPVLKVVGKLVNPKDRPAADVSREVYQLESGGDIGYATSPISSDAVDNFVRTLKDNIEEELQLPNLSTKRIGSAGLSGESRKHLLTDAHLKVGDEKGEIIEILDKEFSVVKALIAKLNPAWKNTIGALEVEHVITPFSMTEDMDNIEVLSRATGGKPFMSQREAIKRAGYVEDADRELSQIQDEESSGMNFDIFAPTE